MYNVGVVENAGIQWSPCRVCNWCFVLCRHHPNGTTWNTVVQNNQMSGELLLSCLMQSADYLPLYSHLHTNDMLNPLHFAAMS